MNENQIGSIIRTLLKVFATWLALHGYQTEGTLLNTPDVIALVIMAVSLAWSHFSHAAPIGSGASSNPPSRGSMLGLILLAGLFGLAGCASTGGSGSAVSPVQISQDLHFVAENGTYIALQKQPAVLPTFELAVSAITNATAGGTLNLNATNLVSALNSLGYGGLANIPGASLFINDINFAASQFDAQIPAGNNVLNNTNLVPALNAIASGIQAGIADYKP